MPASAGFSSCSTVRPILPRPRARSVPRCCGDWPMALRVCVIRTFATCFLWRLVGQDFGHGLPADLRDVLGAAQPPQAVHRRLGHVDRIRRAEALREDVADAGELQHRTHAATGDDARSLARGPEQHARGVRLAEDLVRDRRAVLRNGEEVLLRVLDRLRDRKRNLARLAVADADAIDLVADDDERGEREPPSALDDLRDAVDLDNALLELTLALALDHRALDGSEIGCRGQNFKPPSRAASASAFTRPW